MTTFDERDIEREESTMSTTTVTTAPVATNARARNKVVRQVQLTHMILGIQKALASRPTITLSGKDFAPTDLVSLLQRGIDAIQRTEASRAAFHVDVQAERTTLAEIAPVFADLVALVRTTFGDTQAASDRLAVFGLAPRKRRPVDTATQSHAVAQARATRLARGTTSKKQKAKIKGVAPQPPPASGG
jgi:hypothetical protein